MGCRVRFGLGSGRGNMSAMVIFLGVEEEQMAVGRMFNIRVLAPRNSC